MKGDYKRDKNGNVVDKLPPIIDLNEAFADAASAVKNGAMNAYDYLYSNSSKRAKLKAEMRKLVKWGWTFKKEDYIYMRDRLNRVETPEEILKNIKFGLAGDRTVGIECVHMADKQKLCFEYTKSHCRPKALIVKATHNLGEISCPE